MLINSELSGGCPIGMENTVKDSAAKPCAGFEMNSGN
jgi:hypothetical protein